MSLPAVVHALYSVRGIDPTAKLILVVIADHTNPQTGWAWPSTSRLADLAGVSKRSAIRHIDALEAAGLLVVNRRSGRSSGYRIILKTPETPTGDTSVTTPEPTGDTPEPTGDTHVTAPVTPTSPPTGDAHDTGTNQPVTPMTRTGDTGVTRTSKNLQTEEEEEDAGGADSAARLAGRVDIVTQIIPDSWGDIAVVCDDPRLDVVDELTESGWTTERLRAACAVLPRPHSNPTGLLARHLGHYRGTPPDAVTVHTTTSPPPASPPMCPHDLPAHVWCHDCHHNPATPPAFALA